MLDGQGNPYLRLPEEVKWEMIFHFFLGEYEDLTYLERDFVIKLFALEMAPEAKFWPERPPSSFRTLSSVTGHQCSVREILLKN